MKTLDLKTATASIVMATLAVLALPTHAVEEEWRAAEQVVQDTSDAMLVLIEGWFVRKMFVFLIQILLGIGI